MDRCSKMVLWGMFMFAGVFFLLMLCFSGMKSYEDPSGRVAMFVLLLILMGCVSLAVLNGMDLLTMGSSQPPTHEEKLRIAVQKGRIRAETNGTNRLASGYQAMDDELAEIEKKKYGR